MGKQILRIFLKGFLQAIIVLGCMIICAVGGFFGTRYYYQWKNTKAAKIGTEAQRDDVSKNLIYVWDEKKEKINSCVLEVFDTNQQTMSYITLPGNGQVTLSAELFQKMYQSKLEVPQVVTISKLRSYFESDEDAFEYGVAILEDAFDIDISYYTAVPSLVFNDVFETKKISTGGNKKEKGNVLKDGFLSEMSQYTEKDSLEEQIKNFSDKVKSNLREKDKLSYVEDYLQLKQESIAYYCIPGKKEGNNYIIHEEKAAQLFQKCGVESGASAAGDSGDETAGSESDVKQLSNLVVLNSTTTTGVAARWSERLKENGYNVINIGNYSTPLTNTKIIVSKEGQGEELLSYFSNAEIEVGTVSDGADAEVIIGTDDVALD